MRQMVAYRRLKKWKIIKPKAPKRCRGHLQEVVYDERFQLKAFTGKVLVSV